MLAARSTATGIAGGMPMSAEMTMTETATAGVSRSTWAEVADVIELAGQLQLIELASQNGIHTKGTPYEWEHGYIPLTPAAAASHGHGKVPKGWHAPGGRSKDAAKAEPVKAPPDRFTGPDGTMAMGNWHAGHQAIAQAPLDVLPKDRSRQVPVPGSKYGRNVKGAWSDPVWVAKPGGGYAMSARWKSKEQQVAEHDGGKTSYVTHPAMDERVLTPYGGDTSGKKAQEDKAKAEALAAKQEAEKAQRAEAAEQAKQQDVAKLRARMDQQVKAVAAQRARNETERQRKADGAALAREKGIEPGAHVFIDAGPKKGGIGTVRSVGDDGRPTVEHMGTTMAMSPADVHAHPLPGAEAKRMQAVNDSAESAKRDAEMRQRESEAAQSNSRGMDRMMALNGARRAHFAESTGMTIPDSGQFSLGGASSDFNQAQNHLLAGRNAEGLAALDRAIAYKQAERGKVTKAEQGRRDKLQKFRDQVAQATANPKPVLPTLARMNGTQKRDGSFTALDHEGTEHTVKFDKTAGMVSVSTAKGTRSGPALDDPTRTARMLAGSLAGTSPVVGTTKLGKPIRVGDTVAVRATQGGKWSDAFKAGGTGMVHSAPDGQHINVMTGQKNGYITAQAADITHKQGGTTVQTASSWDDLAAVIDLAAALAKPPAARPAGTMNVTAAGNAATRTTRSAGVSRQPAAVTPPKTGRPRLTPLTPMRQDAAKSMTKLADDMRASHPEMSAHQHVRDAARMLRAGHEEAAQRHLRGAMFSLSPQSVMRHGIHTDDGFIAARQAMHSVHRHLLLVKDIEDVGAKNRQAIARHAGGDDTASPPQPAPPVHADPNAGYGPGALAQKPTARQPGGDRALNAPDRTNSGGSDPAVADPVGPQPRGSKQFTNGARMATDLASSGGHHVAGTPDTYSHGWKLRDIGGGKKELFSEFPTADKMSRTALKQHMDLHHNGGMPIGGRRVGPRNPSKDQLLAVHEAMHADEPLSVNPPGSADNSALKGGLSRTSAAHTHGNTTGMARSWDEVAMVIDLAAGG